MVAKRKRNPKEPVSDTVLSYTAPDVIYACEIQRAHLKTGKVERQLRAVWVEPKSAFTRQSMLRNGWREAPLKTLPERFDR